MKRSRIKPVSAKRRSITKARRETRERVLERDKFACQAQIPGCSFHATDVHELKSRARGGSILEDANCISLCRTCHAWITEHPKWATERGFLLHATDGPAEYRAAERERLRYLYGEEVMDDGQDS